MTLFSNAVALRLGLLICAVLLSSYTPGTRSVSEEDCGPGVSCSKRKPRGDFSYREIHPEPQIKNLKMIGYVARCGIEGKDATEKLYGAILRAKRFENITEKVESKYGLPRNILLAMIMQETGGADMLPNCRDDGGIGICHMQSSTASLFGMKTHMGFNKLVSKEHGRILRNLIKTHKYDRKKLIKYDDRFHPLLNVDAAGRMLFCYKQTKIRGLTHIQSAIRRYAGKYNYRHYWKNVEYYRKKLNDPAVMKAIETQFNKKNPNLIINGKKGDFKSYIRAHQLQNENYGLTNYK